MASSHSLACLLAVFVFLFAGAALPAPHRVHLSAPRAERGLAGDRSDIVSVPTAAAPGARQPHARTLLQQEDGGGSAGQRDPLPNFEMGVPAPRKKSFREWQASGVREREQQFTSSSFLTPGHPGLGYVAICVIARDAHADVLEWISHHVRLGVSKIYLWDHASLPPMLKVVQGYVSAGIVEYQHFSEFEHPSGKPQLYAYEQCLQRGHLHTWMAFIDVDEFLMFRDPWPPIQSLPAFLATFEGPQAPPAAVAGVAVHWLIFGSSGHESRPAGGVLRSYHRCLPLRHAQHALVKTIVRTSCTPGVEGPHNFRHNCSLPVLQTDKSPMVGARSEEPVHTTLTLHHYAVKSREEFALKMLRGSAMRRQRGWEYFDFVDEWSSEFNWDGLTIWDTVATFQHYPAITNEHLQRYQNEQHENFWLKGADDPRYQQQLQQEQAAGAAAAATAAADAAAATQATEAAAAVQQQQQQQQQAGAGEAGAAVNGALGDGQQAALEQGPLVQKLTHTRGAGAAAEQQPLVQAGASQQGSAQEAAVGSQQQQQQ